MTGRQRVLAAFRHETPDRTPIFEREITSPTDVVVLGRPSSLDHFPRRMLVWEQEGWEGLVEQQATDVVDLAEIFGFDMVRLQLCLSSTGPRPEKLDDWTWRQGERISRFHPESGVVETIEPPPVTLEDTEARWIADLDMEYQPSTIADDELTVLRRAKEIMKERGLDLAIYVSLYVMPIAALPQPILLWFHTDKKLLHEYYRRQTERAITVGSRMVSEGADVLGLGGDFAGDTGPMISPNDYLEQVVPHIRRQADALHGDGAFVTNTTDGDLWGILDAFLIESHVDGYGEIDVAAGMDLRRLKQEWGDRCVFLGNLDIRHVLCSGTEDDARKMMIECIENGGPDGGHVIMTSNVVHQDVKPHLYLATLAAYRDYFDLPPLRIA